MTTATKIVTLLKQLIAHPSVTGTAQEQGVEDFIYEYLQALPYFKAHPDHCGQVAIEQDPFGRKIVYALVKGNSPKTMVFLNHHDVVSTECYGAAESLAYDADKITQLLAQEQTEAGKEFASGAWLGGRGSCDMKGGAAAQLVYLEEYSQKPSEGSLLFLSVADEESYSAGMRQALPFLEAARTKWSLEYTLAVNCEPNRRERDKQIVSVGSVGKILATVLLQGKTTHISAYASGLNPLGILSGLVARTEGQPELQEAYGEERTIPPVWLKARDQKENYDVSTPIRASGYCSFQAFTQGPKDILKLLKAKLRASADTFSHCQQEAGKLPIYSYQEFLAQINSLPGLASWQSSILQQLQQQLNKGAITYPEATLTYLNALLDFSDYKEPLALIAFAPPYYPATNSRLMSVPFFEDLLTSLSEVQSLHFEEYFLGVSDCSYLGNTLASSDTAFAPNAPLWGETYSFKETALSSLQIPFLLLGPWGKDLHQRTERVNLPSLTEELPRNIALAAKYAWK